MIRYPYLQDYAFLNAVAKANIQTKYVRINILDRHDCLIKSIEGIAKNGGLNFNGASAMRRSGNLTLSCSVDIADVTNVDNLISINKRVEVEIGVKNIFMNYIEYPILWFPQGVYVFSNPSVSHNVGEMTISLNLKDKMALLNGELGGILPGAITHHPLYNEVGESEPAIVRDILYTLLVTFGDIPPERIIIDNIPLAIKNTVRWLGRESVYSSGTGDNFVLWDTPAEGRATYGFNDNLGYRYTDFTYPAAELLSQPGETITSVLDKIKNALGNYEYFFDIYGFFRFQEKDNGLNDGSPLENWGDAINTKYLEYNTQQQAQIEVEALQMTSLQNTPKYDGVKNNIVIWGEKSDTKLPIRYHLMIDYIPAVEAGKVYKGWIYRNLDGDKLNPQPTGAFRAISEEKYKKLKDKLRGYVQFEYTLNTETDWRLALYLHFALEDYNFTDEYAFLAKEIVEELPKIYNLLTLVEKEAVFSDSDYELQKGRGQWLCMLRQTDGKEIPDTESANWYLDILDVSQIPSLRGLAISAIGRRDKVISDKAVNCLFTPNFNDVIFLERGETAASQRAYIKEAQDDQHDTAPMYQVTSEVWDCLGIGRATYAAFDALRTQLHDTIGYNEALSVTMNPAYFIEPNTRIRIYDPEANVEGEYIINSGSIPLDVGGKMQLSVSKAVERI